MSIVMYRKNGYFGIKLANTLNSATETDSKKSVSHSGILQYNQDIIISLGNAADWIDILYQSILKGKDIPNSQI